MFGLDQLDSTYISLNTVIITGPSSWLGEMALSGLVPDDSIPGTPFNYSF